LLSPQTQRGGAFKPPSQEEDSLHFCRCPPNHNLVALSSFFPYIFFFLPLCCFCFLFFYVRDPLLSIDALFIICSLPICLLCTPPLFALFIISILWFSHDILCETWQLHPRWVFFASNFSLRCLHQGPDLVVMFILEPLFSANTPREPVHFFIVCSRNLRLTFTSLFWLIGSFSGRLLPPPWFSPSPFQKRHGSFHCCCV